MGATRKLSEYAASLRLEQVDREVVGYTKRLILDQLGCQLAGATLPWSKATYRAVKAMAGLPSPDGHQATVVLLGDRLPVPEAAFVNSAFGHAFEYDDTNVKSPTHPGSIVIPAALAVGESRGASGKDLLEAVIAGYEVCLRVTEACTPSLALRGHHPPPGTGPFGAAAAAARLMRLSAEQTLQALAIAGSHAAGLAEYAHSGGSVKRLHSAIPAQAGVRSAYLAEAGITGPATVLEGEKGFCKVFAGVEDAEAALTDELGKRYALLNTAIKMHCSHISTHSSIEAFERILQQGVRPEDIRDIEVRTSKNAVAYTGNIKRPRDIMGAQVSLAFALAVRAYRRSNGFWDYREEDLHDPRFVALAEKVRPVIDEEFGTTYPKRFGAVVTVTLHNGDQYSQRVMDPKGFPFNPASDDDIRAKFMQLVEPILQKDLAEALMDIVFNLEQVDNVRDLVALAVKPVAA